VNTDLPSSSTPPSASTSEQAGWKHWAAEEVSNAEAPKQPEPLTGWQALLNLLQTHWQPMQPHWQELGTRLKQSLVLWALALVGAWCLQNYLLHALQGLAPKGQVFVQLVPGELLWVSCKLTLVLSSVLAAPGWFTQALFFLLPGLTAKEKRMTLIATAMGWLLLPLGLLLAWYVLVPVTLGFLLNYGQQLAPYQLSIARYTDFILLLLLLSSATCLLPIGLWVLATLGLFKTEWLWQHWRSVLIAVALLAAVLTPSQDPLCMLLVAALLVALLGFSVVLLKLVKA
jgi:sec-independent protein translocase protein TatC